MLKRAVTGLILAPLVLLAVYYSNAALFALGVSAILMIAAYEWTYLVPIRHPLIRALTLCLMLVLLISASGDVVLPWFGFSLALGQMVSVIWQKAPSLLWPYFFIMIICYPACQKAWAYKSVVFIGMLIILPACLHWLVLDKIKAHPSGSIHIISLFLMIWGADSGAYFAGKLFGRHKLIPRVSPGKTWEGLLGGLITIFIMRLPFSYCDYLGALSREGDLSWLSYFIRYDLSWVIGVFFSALMGDLLISMFKRRVNLKDTGHLLPGHGGILDRIDSLLCASVVCAFWYCQM